MFSLDEHRYILPLAKVERVFRAVEILPLPKAPEIVLGVINMHGQIIPVFNVRKRFCLPERDIELSDHIIIAQTAIKVVALMVDAADDIIELHEEEVTLSNEILPEMEYVDGVVKLEDGLALIQNLDRFLSINEEKALEDAIKEF